MRHYIGLSTFLIAVPVLFVGVIVAQSPELGRSPEPDRSSAPTRDMFMRAMPVLAALDANKDGVISKAEIDNATGALRSLDANKDGELTEEEMRPDFAGMRGRSGRPSELSGRGGFGRPPEGNRGGFGSGVERGSAGGDNPMIDRLMQMDENGDGKLSSNEVSERLSPLFDRADQNKDGFATRDELGVIASGASRDAGTGRPVTGNPNAVQPRSDSELANIYLKQAQVVHSRYDKDSDGQLTAAEREKMLLNPEAADADQNGKVTVQEYALWMQVRARAQRGSQERTRDVDSRGQERDPSEFFSRMFVQRDVNKDGKLSRDEMPEQMAGRLEQMDTDGDGTLSRSEMEAMMSRMNSRSGLQSRRSGSARRDGVRPSDSSRAGGDLPRRPEAE